MTILTRPLTWFATAALSLAALPAMAASAVQPFQADYQASYMGMQANGTMSVTSEGANKWRYSLKVKNQLADLSQSTVFEDANGQLRPLSSQDSSVLLVKKRNVQATYNWTSNQAAWTGDLKPDRRGPIALKPGDLDALLINLAIMRDLAANKPLNYRMVDEGRIKPMSYKVVGKEQVNVGGKSYEATKVSRVDGNKELIAWIVPQLPVPARLLQRENDRDALDLTIKAVN
ncbi:MAG: hypothetical protein GAK43_00065 [Stenotrophomonas maltophilia]|nr:MAG: hypothetical protein GAK43_00065 [Stenotrophomonas maltophilia]